MEPLDHRLAELYDADNPDGPDHDYFRSVADRLDAQRIVDLGCGTGMLTVTLATGTRTVIGIDPDAAMLNIARNRQGSERVNWIRGDSRAIGDAEIDLVVMTGNVAQHVVPTEWMRTLTDVAANLRVGGVLCFESRNPTTEAWRDWAATEASTRATRHGELTEWLEVNEPDQTGTVVLSAHNLWRETGEELTVIVPLTFRSLTQLEQDLKAAGLPVSNVCGGWMGEPFTGNEPVMVVEATRAR